MTTDRGDSFASQLASGASVGNGRYQLLLLTPHGGRTHLQFWQGFDMASGQDVALTLVDPDCQLPEEFVHEILARTVRLKGIDMPGVAGVLEVFHTGRFGVVVSEWIHGGGIRQIAATAPSPTGVAGAMQSLAAATEAAHRAGLVMSIDCPSRLRIGVDGHAALAFPASMPDTTVASDLRGIGSAMCALLNLDVRQAAGNDPKIPFLISTTISGLLRDSGGIASAATLLTLLREATGNDAAAGRIMPPLAPPPSGSYAGSRNYGPDDQAAAARRQIMRIGMMTAAAIVVIALVALGSALNRFLGNNHSAVGLNTDKLGLTAPTSSAAQPPPTVVRKRAAADEPVQPVAVSVFSPDGSPDSPGSAGAAIDGNPATAWSTDTYVDADPFRSSSPASDCSCNKPDPRLSARCRSTSAAPEPWFSCVRRQVTRPRRCRTPPNSHRRRQCSRGTIEFQWTVRRPSRTFWCGSLRWAHRMAKVARRSPRSSYRRRRRRHDVSCEPIASPA
jgi:putative peptidoglycan lipid II flippase